jgi:hypothetical protein
MSEGYISVAHLTPLPSIRNSPEVATMSEGYISVALRGRVRAAAGDRCGYCLSPQRLVLGQLEIEHLLP